MSARISMYLYGTKQSLLAKWTNGTSSSRGNSAFQEFFAPNFFPSHGPCAVIHFRNPCSSQHLGPLLRSTRFIWLASRHSSERELRIGSGISGSHCSFAWSPHRAIMPSRRRAAEACSFCRRRKASKEAQTLLLNCGVGRFLIRNAECA
jgi:hypothetical protein